LYVHLQNQPGGNAGLFCVRIFRAPLALCFFALSPLNNASADAPFDRNARLAETGMKYPTPRRINHRVRENLEK
jgi:hypothetical protein